MNECNGDREQVALLSIAPASNRQVSNEKNPSCIGYIGDYTTQLDGDCNKTIIRIPIKQPVKKWIVKVISLFGSSPKDLVRMVKP